MLQLTPLVIPGVILAFQFWPSRAVWRSWAAICSASRRDFLRPGLPLVVLGQFSYIAALQRSPSVHG